MVHGRYLVDMLRSFICLVALFEDHIGAQQNIVYFEKGESVTLFCKVNPTSWCTWDGPSVDGGEFTTYSDMTDINQQLPNAHRLEIIGNISLGEYNLHISNASDEDKGAYRCSITDKATMEKHVYLQMKVQPSYIKVNGANKGVLEGIEGRQILLNCSVKSGIPEESILWYNGSLLLGRGGPGMFTMTIVPQRYDDKRTFTCIAKSSALRVPLNITIMLNIKYKPVLTLKSHEPLQRLSNTDQIEIHIDEGHNLTISCSVDSNPPVSKVNFYRNLNQFKNAKSAHTLEFIGIKREDKGFYECKAKNGVGETYKNVTVIVKYPPSINITKYSGNTGLQCSPEGEPQNYTFYPWLHKSEFGEFIRQLNSKEIIRFKEEGNNTWKYDLNGMYICRAENGVKDVNGKLLQSGQFLVKHEDKPRFVSENEKNQYGQFGQMIVLKVSVYSHPIITRLEVLRNSTCCLNNSTYIHVENATIKDHIFGKEVQLAGYRITVHGFKLTETDFTSYEFRIGNVINFSSFMVTLNAAEKPQPPRITDVISETESLRVVWIKQFDGGTRQHFVLQYKKDTDDDWRSVGPIEDSTRRMEVHILNNLKSNSVYLLRLFAKNQLGTSNYTDIRTVRTLTDKKNTSQTTMVYTGTVLGCVIVLTGIVMFALWCIKKGRQLKEDRSREHEVYELGSLVDLAVENCMYQSNACPLPNQSSQNGHNVTNQRTGLLSSTENQTMYPNSVNPVRNIDDQMTVENYIYQKGASSSDNVQIKTPNRKIFKNQNSYAITGEHGASGIAARNKKIKFKDKRNSSAVNYNDPQIQERNSMNYAEMVFDDRGPSQEVVIRGSADRTIYTDIDITEVGIQLPEIDEEDDDDDFMYIDGIVDYRKSLNMLNVVK